MSDTRTTALEWFEYFSEISGSSARRTERDAIPAIAERMQRELPNGTDQEREDWAAEFLRQHPQREIAPKKPDDLADYTAKELLEWEATRKPRTPSNPRGIKKPDPKHPGQKRRGEE